MCVASDQMSGPTKMQNKFVQEETVSLQETTRAIHLR